MVGKETTAETPKKTCSKCKIEKEATLGNFAPRRTGKYGLRHECRSCRKDYNRERYTSSGKRDKTHSDRVVREHGLAPGEYEAQLAKQSGVCAICGNPEVNVIRGGQCRLAVDHHHKTGIRRGLLCVRCNTGIGLLNEDPDILMKAVVYLQIWAASIAIQTNPSLTSSATST